MTIARDIALVVVCMFCGVFSLGAAALSGDKNEEHRVKFGMIYIALQLVIIFSARFL